VLLAKFLRTVVQQTDQRPVDVAEAKQAEIVGADEFSFVAGPRARCRRY